MNESSNELGASRQSLDRQIQINEWQYHSKMDTVFALQLVFIAVLIMAVVFYFKKIGKVGSYFAYYVSGLTAILVIMIIINRLFFTSARRDPRFWHRYRFQDDGGKVPSQVSSASMSDFWAGFWKSQPVVESKCPDCNVQARDLPNMATATKNINTIDMSRAKPYSETKTYYAGDVIMFEGKPYKMEKGVQDSRYDPETRPSGYNPANRPDLWTAL